MTTDIDKKILYWIDYFQYEWINCDELIDYIKDNYVRDLKEIINEWCEINNIRINIKYLNWDRIINDDIDYDCIGNNLYLNLIWLEDAKYDLRRQGLIK